MCRCAANKSFGLGLNLLVPHLDLAIDDEGRESGDEVGALALSTIHEGVLGALLREVILLLGAPRARVRTIHGHAWAAWGLVLLWRHKLSRTGLGDVVALGSQPPLVDVKGENADDDCECDTHNNRIAIHLYCTYGKRNQDGGARDSRAARRASSAAFLAESSWMALVRTAVIFWVFSEYQPSCP